MFRVFRVGQFSALMVLLIVSLAGALAATAPKEAPPAGAVIGVVDLDAVAKKYVGYAKAMERITAFANERKAKYDTLQSGMGLDTKEFEEYQQRTSSTVKIDAARVKELEDSAKKTMAEYDALRDKKDQTADEKKRFEALDQRVKTVSAILNDTGQKLSDEIKGEYDRYTKSLTTLVDEGVAKVAAGKKCTIVVSRDVQTKDGVEKFVLWGGTDLTDDVLKHLNDNFKDTLLDLPPAKK